MIESRAYLDILLLSGPQNIALDCIYIKIRLQKYSVKIPIITTALEL